MCAVWARGMLIMVQVLVGLLILNINLDCLMCFSVWFMLSKPLSACCTTSLVDFCSTGKAWKGSNNHYKLDFSVIRKLDFEAWFGGFEDWIWGFQVYGCVEGLSYSSWEVDLGYLHFYPLLYFIGKRGTSWVLQFIVGRLRVTQLINFFNFALHRAWIQVHILEGHSFRSTYTNFHI